MAVTITDIAQRAGVSRSMVSRALTGNGPVNAKKKEEIIALAESMGYMPNQVHFICGIRNLILSVCIFPASVQLHLRMYCTVF